MDAQARVQAFCKMKISVVIPGLVRDALFERAVASVAASCARRLDVLCEMVPVVGVSPVSAARNAGLDRATGDWIAWVDADDEVLPDWFGSIADAIASDSQADVVSFNARVEWADGSTRSPAVVGGAAHAGDVLAERSAGQMWNKVVRRSLFDGVRFAGALHEDYRLLADVLPRARGVVHIDRVLYVYRRRRTGLSQYGDREGARATLDALIGRCEAMEGPLRAEMEKGMVQRIVDYSRRCGSVPAFRSFVRRHLAGVLLDRGISFRVKVKCLLSALS